MTNNELQREPQRIFVENCHKTIPKFFKIHRYVDFDVQHNNLYESFVFFKRKYAVDFSNK